MQPDMVNCRKYLSFQLTVMVEVFSTNVSDAYYAQLLVRRIHSRFPGYRANFDLTDCDRILRIESNSQINQPEVIAIIHRFGYHASVLPDETPMLIFNKPGACSLSVPDDH